MSRNFRSPRSREKRFSIDDAFEEETDDVEQRERTPPTSAGHNTNNPADAMR